MSGSDSSGQLGISFPAPAEFPQTIVYKSEDERLREPWKQALQSQDFSVPWTGRGTPLSRPQRARIWLVFETYRAQLRLAGWIEKEDAYRTVRQIIATRSASLPYVSVVVDEAQDFGQEAFRLIHALARGGEDSSETNRLFLVGDAHQRIYDRQLVLSRCDIRVRGRSFRLRINYRTSGGDPQDGGVRAAGHGSGRFGWRLGHAQGYRSLFHGPMPELRRFGSGKQALLELIAWVENLREKQGLLYEAFCFVARTRGACGTIWKEALQRQGLPVHCLKGRRPVPYWTPMGFIRSIRASSMGSPSSIPRDSLQPFDLISAHAQNVFGWLHMLL